MTNPCRLLSLVLSTALAAAACGSDSDGPSAPPAADLGRWSAPVVIGDGGPGWVGSRFTSGGGTVTGLVLDADGLAAVSFAVAGTPGDPLLATWQAAASTSAAAASWTPPVSLGPAGEFRSWPRDLASDGNGGAAVVGDAGVHLYEARFAEGGWQAGDDIATVRDDFVVDARLLADDRGAGLAVWVDEHVWAAQRAAGGAWLPPVALGDRAQVVVARHAGARTRPFGPATGDHRSHGRRRRALGARASARRDRRGLWRGRRLCGRRRVSGHLDGVRPGRDASRHSHRPVRSRKRLATGDRPDGARPACRRPRHRLRRRVRPCPLGHGGRQAARDSPDSGGVGKGRRRRWSSPCRCRAILARVWRPRRQSMRDGVSLLAWAANGQILCTRAGLRVVGWHLRRSREARGSPARFALPEMPPAPRLRHGRGPGPAPIAGLDRVRSWPPGSIRTPAD